VSDATIDGRAVGVAPGKTGIAARARYNRVAAWLHWLVGLALLGQIAFGFLLDEIAPRGTPARASVVNLHKSIGIVLGVLIALRLAWRAGHALPPWPVSMSAARRRAALLGHRALYGCMIVMPLAGYVASNFSKHGVRFFGIALAPWGPDSPAAYGFFNGVHVVTAFVFSALIVGHLAMALQHAFVERDDSFGRILP
jgi:cytochrome b561